MFSLSFDLLDLGYGLGVVCFVSQFGLLSLGYLAMSIGALPQLDEGGLAL